LNELSKYFDHYTINARFKPAFFTLLPAAITVLSWHPDAKTLMGSILTILISFGVMTFISGLISNLGNTLQDKLFNTWGGAPTTVIIRYANPILDEFTKIRYRQWLETKIDGLSMPSPEEEVATPDIADHKYRSATNFLREYTRDKIKYPAVYRDNVAYGFARNLLSVRGFGLWVSGVSIITNVYLMGILFLDSTPISLIDFIKLNPSYIGVAMFSVIVFIVFLFLVNSNYVRGRAIRYAKSLYETCEQ